MKKLKASFSEQGLITIGKTDVMARWILHNERVRILTYLSLGSGLGHVVSFSLSGYLVQHLGWFSTFYVSGTLPKLRFFSKKADFNRFYLYIFIGAIVLIWCIVWTVFATNDPSTNKFLSTDEKHFLSVKMDHISKNEVWITSRRMHERKVREDHTWL